MPTPEYYIDTIQTPGAGCSECIFRCARLDGASCGVSPRATDTPYTDSVPDCIDKNGISLSYVLRHTLSGAITPPEELVTHYSKETPDASK